MEIQARDFRIGNAVLYPRYTRKGEDKIWFVRDLFFESDMIGLTDGIIQTKVDFSRIVPIPLTEEILLKCEFQYTESGMCGANWRHKEVSLKVDKPSNLMSVYKAATEEDLKDNNYPIFYSRGIGKYVFINNLHQLQNLYFALTNEEIIIEL